MFLYLSLLCSKKINKKIFLKNEWEANIGTIVLTKLPYLNFTIFSINVPFMFWDPIQNPRWHSVITSSYLLQSVTISQSSMNLTLLKSPGQLFCNIWVCPIFLESCYIFLMLCSSHVKEFIMLICRIIGDVFIHHLGVLLSFSTVTLSFHL